MAYYCNILLTALNNCRDLTWLDTRCPPNPVCHSPLSWTEEKKYDKRLRGGEKHRERLLTNYLYRQNRLESGKLVLSITNQIRVE